MSHNVSFPAAHLSAYDIGHRIQFIAESGVKMTDTLTRISATVGPDGEGVELRLFLKNAVPLTHTPMSNLDSYGFRVNPEQMVKRVYK